MQSMQSKNLNFCNLFMFSENYQLSCCRAVSYCGEGYNTEPMRNDFQKCLNKNVKP